MILFKKAMRSIWRGKRSYIACIALMAVGILMYVSFHMMYINLNAAMEKMYAEQDFADAFAAVRGIPLNAAANLAAIDGVDIADAGLVADARVTLAGKENKIITLRLHSYEPDNLHPLNRFLIVEGAAPSENELLVGEPFLKANGLQTGDTLSLTLAGKQLAFTVSGAAQSPEYVYAIPDSGQMLPDNEAFGFAFLPYAQLAAITGNEGLADRLSFQLEPDTGFDDVKYALEDALAPYGLISLIARKDQPSHSMLNAELTGIGSYATSMPAVFIFIAVIILYIMLKRVIEQERGSIGTLKAFGFSDNEVLLHYLCYGLLTGGLGGIFGCIFGLAAAGPYTDVFVEFFNLPSLKASASPMLIISAMLIATVSGALGAFMGTRSVLKLNPGEAMHPPAPPVITGDVLGRLPFIRAMLASNGQMAIRNLSRSKFRSLFIILGVAFSFSLIGFTSSFGDMTDKMLLEQFSKVLLYDVKAVLKEPKPYTGAIEAVYGIDGVERAEGVLEVPCELRLLHRKETVMLTGLTSDAALQRIYDSDGGFYLRPPQGGVILSASLAEKIGAVRGDTLMAKTPYTGDDDIPLPVLGIVNEMMGSTAYMDIDSLCGALGVPKAVNSALIAANDVAAVKSALEGADNVSAVTDLNETRKVYDDMMQTYGFMFVIMQFSGIGVAYAIITNTSSISMSERKREYATLRVLGMHPREIGRILGFEYWLLTIVGIVCGIPLIRMMKEAMADMLSEVEMFTMPLGTPFSSYVTAVVGCCLTVALCNLLASRQIAKFDMVEVLKERE